LEGDAITGYPENTAVANSHAKYIWSQISQRLPTRSYRLTMNNPVLVPDISRYSVGNACLLERIAKLGSK
jgi:hypothetical protein